MRPAEPSHGLRPPLWDINIKPLLSSNVLPSQKANNASPPHPSNPSSSGTNIKPFLPSNVLSSQKLNSQKANNASPPHRSNPSSSGTNMLNRPHPTATAHSFSKRSMDRASATTTSIAEVWRSWPSLSIHISNVPVQANTFMIWEAFKEEGAIDSIDLFEDLQGNRMNKGKVRFRPPPRTDFWRSGQYTLVVDGREVVITIKCDTRGKEQTIESPVRQGIRYPSQIIVPIQSIDIGALGNTESMFLFRHISERIMTPCIVMDLWRREIEIHFQLKWFNNMENPKSHEDKFHDYRVKIPLGQLTRIWETETTTTQSISHIFTLEYPPMYRRRAKKIETSFASENVWRDMDTWFRQTDIVHAPEKLVELPISLRKINSIINIGRWKTFRINYRKNAGEDTKFRKLSDALRDFNVEISPNHKFEFREPAAPVIWDWIDPPEKYLSTVPTSSLDDLTGDNFIGLPFSVRYQLEVCLSHGYLSEYTADKEFVQKLKDLGENKAKNLLEHVVAEKEVYHDAMRIFDIKFVKGAIKVRVPANCCYIRSATVTPATIYYHTPSVDVSNRVIRRYIEHSDRFLRVRFSDEKYLGRINSTEGNTMNEVFTRIFRAMNQGITLGDRHYDFLAFGNSQFREHGAYFFASMETLTASHIRAWMGNFDAIKNIAKYAARLGQCFSTTRAVTGCPVEVRNIDDVVRNGYTFSDGVGRISPFLADMAANELKISKLKGDTPSAFQFRLGGCKGMLATWPDPRPREVHIRPSQDKFPTLHHNLEIIRWSQFSMASLNRQLIIVLSTLGIPDEIFHEKLRIMLSNLDHAMTNKSQAVCLLQKYIDPNEMTLLLARILEDGFQASREPFVMSVLSLWRVWQIKYLKEKARIVIDNGASLLGCMDETGILKGYDYDRIPDKNASAEEKSAALPEIFVQISRTDQRKGYQVIEGPCILARNPSLHPGDIRVVNAVNVPQLGHLKDVVVLPKLGDRDISSMCSGGDLDGDDYLVIWDRDLLPDDWFREPMNYTAGKGMTLDRDVTVKDITSFFVTYMKNDCLPRIAHAHLAWADYLPDGVDDKRCMRLAKLHSDAVDYNKTGNPAKMTRDLRPRMWPHFMEKNHKPKEKIYKSGRILGQLYDAVERVDFAPNLEMPFDNRILDSGIAVSEDLMEFSKQLKEDYDLTVRRIMAQHEIQTEFEVWSTFVLGHSHTSNDYKFHEEIGGISSTLRDRFRTECYNKVGGRHFRFLAPLAVAMYQVTCDEMNAALRKFHSEKNFPNGRLFQETRPGIKDLPLISFPWILPDILGKIAVSCEETELQGPILMDNDLMAPGYKKSDSLAPVSELEMNASVNEYSKAWFSGLVNPEPLSSTSAEPESRGSTKKEYSGKNENLLNDEAEKPGSVSLIDLADDSPDTDQTVHIVEQEGDVKSNAVDILSMLLGVE
ncbi:RNA dependent RNA polymerase domain containing protein [Elaphomyces granulatus]